MCLSHIFNEMNRIYGIEKGGNVNVWFTWRVRRRLCPSSCIVHFVNYYRGFLGPRILKKEGVINMPYGYGYGGGFGYGGCGTGFGGGFALIVVLFILLIIVGAACFR